MVRPPGEHDTDGQFPCRCGRGMNADRHVLIVDGANVVGSRPDGWWRDRAGAARRLHGALAEAIGAGRLDPLVVLVLEGAARAGVPPGRVAGILVVHAAGSGDDEVVRHMRAGSRVVTADRELRGRVTAAGGEVVGPSWLWDRDRVRVS